MNLAAVDIGTNSVRLLIIEQNGREIARPMRITRLGQGVDVTGKLGRESIARTTKVLAEYRALLERWSVERIRVTATSAARDASNRDEFFDAAEAALGARPELLSGEEEARLSFWGATRDLQTEGGPFLILDIGGGSTELAFGTTEPEALISLQLGCVRMTERHFKADPPTEEEIEACFADVRGQLVKVAETIDLKRVRQVVGLAGTVTALSALQLGLTQYDATRTHHSVLTRAQVEILFERLRRVSVAERRGLLAEPERAGVIVGGAAVLLTTLRELDIAQLLVSERDILDGLAASLVSGMDWDFVPQ
jgi:exopolyphosphatase/guanosine-5'-triphosphate,3'-diphosphate pyrophosphatase